MSHHGSSAVIFFEKPGCISNRKQKDILQDAGLQLDVRNLLTNDWTPETLAQFFGDLPVTEWFNRSAPAVKEGRVNPEQLSAEQALAAMVAEPLLIRRPLMQYGDTYVAGFDLEKLQQALPELKVELQKPAGIESCSNTTAGSCPQPGAAS